LTALRKQRAGKIIGTILAEDVSGKLRLDDSLEGRELRRLAANGFDELRVADIDRVFGARADDVRDRFDVWEELLKPNKALLVDEFEVLDSTSVTDEGRFYDKTRNARIEREKLAKRSRLGREA